MISAPLASHLELGPAQPQIVFIFPPVYVFSPQVNYAEEIRYRPEEFKVTKREMMEIAFGDIFQVVSPIFSFKCDLLGV